MGDAGLPLPRTSALICAAMAALMLSACARPAEPVRETAAACDPVPVCAPEPSGPENAAALGAELAEWPDLSTYDSRALSDSLAAFARSCSALTSRADTSGLTRPGDWQAACEAAEGMPEDPAHFLRAHFTPVRVGDGAAHATGYFELEIAGSRQRIPGYDVPVLGRPDDLVEADLGAFLPQLAGRRIQGRVEGNSLVPYGARGAIESDKAAEDAPVIAWAKDPAELFFLHIQGSGRLRAPDGTVMRVGYASSNGRAYRSIGGMLLDQGRIGPGEASMQGILSWLQRHPDEARGVMRANERYIFFEEREGAPLGALGVPVTARASVAADPDYVPLGAPVLLTLDRPEASGLWVAQDIGSAIKGANRFDTFWGAGAEARRIAGGMSGRGSALILLPRAAAARLAP